MGFQNDKPGVYTIRVAGFLNKSWSDRLGGLTITNSELVGEGAMPVTTLTGALIDQAALLGVLNALYGFHYPLLSVEYSGSISGITPRVSPE